MKIHHCWRCGKDLPFLDEREWIEIEPLLADGVEAIKAHRAEHGSTLAEARAVVRTPAMEKFLELTGVDGMHADTIHHHRLASHGSACPQCDHLLRSPTANFCANCGRPGDAQHPRP